MMGRLKSDQGQLFYEFRLGDAVPEDHLVRKIDTGLDLTWLRSELAPHYSSMGRPSIDPELMIRMLVIFESKYRGLPHPLLPAIFCPALKLLHDPGREPDRRVRQAK